MEGPRNAHGKVDGAAGLVRIVHLTAHDAAGHPGSGELAAALPGCIAALLLR
ncbi:hypothetical protein LZC95_09255 [Pendulispora brunnea]|uniref:Uncharacterized protein n=1 Tax=Pendulispora brunnea TaxID=2905690 RepID=A0ABZ2KEA6_9BACT